MKIIGLSGVAGCGKDTFFAILQSKMECRRISLADKLKQEVQEWCQTHYKIDPLNCTREEKEIIRPFLVFHATRQRKSSEGRYWIDQLQSAFRIVSPFNQFPVLNEEGVILRHDETVVITDIRYDDYDQDEVFWLKNELDGILVHVAQYEEKIDPNTGGQEEIYKAAANGEEARNDPKIKEKADYSVEWPKISCASDEELYNSLSLYVEDFIEWMKNQ